VSKNWGEEGGGEQKWRRSRRKKEWGGKG